MKDNAEDFGLPTPPRKASDTPPPPWPRGDDPRTVDCKHDWPGSWGQVGERQRLCLRCDRWVWERNIWPCAQPDLVEPEPEPVVVP